MWKQLNSWKFQYFLYSIDGNWLALSENVAKVSTSLRKWLPRPLERSSREKVQGSRGFFDPTLNTGGFRLRWNWKCLTESIRWLTSAFWDSSLRLTRGLGLEAIIATVLSFSPVRRELKYPFFFFFFSSYKPQPLFTWQVINRENRHKIITDELQQVPSFTSAALRNDNLRKIWRLVSVPGNSFRSG